MTRYEIQDEKGFTMRLEWAATDQDAINDVEFSPFNGSRLLPPRPFRLVRIEEETPQEADKARMDWMSNPENAMRVVCVEQRDGFCWYVSVGHPEGFNNARAAIDHARGYAPTVIKEYPNE